MSEPLAVCGCGHEEGCLPRMSQKQGRRDVKIGGNKATCVQEMRTGGGYI